MQLVIRALLAGGIRELSNAGGIRGGGVTSLLSHRKTVGFFRGARHATPTSRQSGARHVKVGRLQVQGLDTSRRCHLTGRDSLSRCRLPGYMPSLRLSVDRSFTTPIQPVPIPSTRFFSPFRFTVFVTEHTLTHLRPGPSGVTGLMGSLLDLMRRNWVC